MSQSESTSASDEQSPLAAENKLQKLLDRIAHLNLTGKISDKSSTMTGHGGNGDVFTGFYSIGSPDENTKLKVAIKRLRIHTMGDNDAQKKLVKELYIWTKLYHPYILSLQGFYYEDGNYPCLVSEWMENGTILAYLQSYMDCDLQKTVLHIAEGVNYLHKCGIIHSDIKPDNILVSSSGEPRICDFGISHMVVTSGTFDVNSTAGNPRGTYRFMSIELLKVATGDQSESHTYSEASDVWAFGMTVFELLTKKAPYSHIRIDLQVIYAITSGTLPEQPEEYSTTWSELYRFLWKLCDKECCWAPTPSKRPSMIKIISILETFSTPQQETHSTPQQETLSTPAKQKTSSTHRQKKSSTHQQETPTDDSLNQLPQPQWGSHIGASSLNFTPAAMAYGQRVIPDPKHPRRLVKPTGSYYNERDEYSLNMDSHNEDSESKDPGYTTNIRSEHQLGQRRLAHYGDPRKQQYRHSRRQRVLGSLT